MTRLRSVAFLASMILLAGCGSSPVAPLDPEELAPALSDAEPPCPPPVEGEEPAPNCRGGYIGSGS